MFENALKGMKSRRSKGLKAFSGKDANRWKKEGSVSNMVSFKKLKGNKWWK